MAIKTIEPGTVFGHLTVWGQPGSNKHGQAMYACRCTCGKTAIVAGYKLRRGEAKSCGCKRATLRMATMAETAKATDIIGGKNVKPDGVMAGIGDAQTGIGNAEITSAGGENYAE